MSQWACRAISAILGLGGLLLLLGGPAEVVAWGIAGNQVDRAERIRMVGGLLFGVGLLGVTRAGLGAEGVARSHSGRPWDRSVARGQHG